MITDKTARAWGLAETAYQAYGEQAGWKNYQGNPMPTWNDLPEAIRLCWLAAALAVEHKTRPSDSYRERPPGL